MNIHLRRQCEIVTLDGARWSVYWGDGGGSHDWWSAGGDQWPRKISPG